MGLILLRVRFPGGAPPSEAEFARALAARAGSSSGLDAYAVEGETVTITTAMGPVLCAYALQLLLERGGEHVDPASGAPAPVRLPAFVQRPWRAWPWYTRVGIHARFHLGLLRPPARTHGE